MLLESSYSFSSSEGVRNKWISNHTPTYMPYTREGGYLYLYIFNRESLPAVPVTCCDINRDSSCIQGEHFEFLLLVKIIQFFSFNSV